MSDEIFGGQKITQRFPITVGGLPDLDRRPQRLIFPRVALTALKGQDNFTETYQPVTIRSLNSDPVLRDVVPGDYVLEYSAYGLDSEGNQAATYYSPQPRDRVLAVSSIRPNANSLKGEVIFDVPGTYSWTAPMDVEPVSVVCVGGGGGPAASTSGASGGGGGGLGWRNNIAVTPGETYTVVVGAGGTRTTSGSAGSGGDSYFIDINTVAGLGGEGGATASNLRSPGGSYVGDGGGDGGAGGGRNGSTAQAGGGGGAGGYTGPGGQGGSGVNSTAEGVSTSGQGGGGGGGGGCGTVDTAGSGGGVGIFGQGASGSRGPSTGADGRGGFGGSRGSDASEASTSASPQNRYSSANPSIPGQFGGGGAGSDNPGGAEQGDGGHGAVRIIWGLGAQYPFAASGSPNHVFVDSSLNDHDVGKNNLATQGSVSPYESTLSAEFSGNDDYVVVEPTENLSWGTDDFTVEGWIKPVNNSFQIIKSDQTHNFNLGYNIDSVEQGLVLGNKDIPSVERIQTIDVDTASSAVVDLDTDKIRFIASTGASVSASYEISGISSQEIGGIAQFGEMTVESNGADVFTLEVLLTSNILGTKQFTFTVTRSEVQTAVVVEFINNQQGEVVFDVPGTYSWTAPFEPTPVSVVCVGGGGGPAASTSGASGGGGGGLGWRNNIAVTPGETYTVVVGAGGTRTTSGIAESGGDSYFIDTATVAGLGGEGGATSTNRSRQGGQGGSYVGDGGGDGGAGGAGFGTTDSGGGGGAGGYSGAGGSGGSATGTVAESGQGGGGGGGGRGGASDTAGSGGGVGIFGIGASGASGTDSLTDGTGGGGGSGGSDATAAGSATGNIYNSANPSTPGQFGGGGAGSDNPGGAEQGDGGHGAVRIVWGAAVAFPAAAPEPSTTEPQQSLNSIVGPSNASLGKTLEYSVLLDPALGIQTGTALSYTVSGIDPASIAGSPLTGTTIVRNEQSVIIIKTVEVGVTSTLSISVTVPGFGVISTTTDLEVVELYKVHTFTSSGTFTIDATGTGTGGVVTTTTQGNPTALEYLIVGGGGGGSMGGGGAGGLLTGSISTTSQTYTITVGQGGNRTTSTRASRGSNGGNSSAFGLTAIGGGGGGAYGDQGVAVRTGNPGGSGGGGGGLYTNQTDTAGGAGTVGQGNDGGRSENQVNGTAGGGGGAGSPGLDGEPGTGGNGTSSSISGAFTFYAGGGGGGSVFGPFGAGGAGGGGDGGRYDPNSFVAALDGTANTGGGGGGGTSDTFDNAGNGGSGIVIVKYKAPAINGLTGPAVANWGTTVEYRFVADDLSDGTQISFSISNLNSSDLVNNILLSSATIIRNNVAIIKLKTTDQETIKDITVVILNVNNADGTAITFTTKLQPRLKLVTNSFFDLNQWNYFAVTRSADNLRMYINGQRKLTANIANYTFSNDSTGWHIGGPDTFLQGRLADMRLLTQEARYTQLSEPVPTLRLDAITGTKLLTFNSSVEFTDQFQDISAVNNTITSFGVTSIYDNPVGFRPYTPGQGYGSGFFINSDFLTVANDPTLNFGDGDFTVEAWIHLTTETGHRAVAALDGYTSTRRSWSLAIRDADLELRYSTTGAGSTLLRSSPVVTANRWHHVAYVRTGSTVTGYVDGVSVIAGSISGSLYNNTDDPVSVAAIGPDYTGFFDGYIADLRIIKGTAVYTNNFKPSITPLATTAETVLHLKFDNATVYDEIRNHNLAFNLGAQTDVTVVNEQIVSLDCTGLKYVTISLPPPARLNMAGTDLYSLEFDFLNTAFIENTVVASYGTLTSPRPPWLFRIRGTGSLRFYSGSDGSTFNVANDLVVIDTMTINKWYKIRLTRTAQGYEIYVNGKLVLTAANSGNFVTPPNSRNFMAFGADADGNSPSSIYVEGIRLWNTVNAATPTNIIGLRESEKFIEHTYADDFFDNSELDFTINYVAAALGISTSKPTLQIVSIGVVQPIISFRTETRLQFVIGPNGSATLVDTTPDNDPTLDRNPTPAGEADAPVLRRIWY